MDQPAIELRGLRKVFRMIHQRHGTLKRAALNLLRRQKKEWVVAIDHLDLEVAHGETLAVIGRNGSGKSTLLGILSRVYRPTAGIVKVNGKIAPLLELGAGFHPDLNGIENIYLDASILGLSRRQTSERLDSILEFAFVEPGRDLRSFADIPVRNYSDGMKMRLGFSVAIHTDPDILLVDEVLAVGDELFQHRCLKKISEFQQAGKTIIFVSHQLWVIEKVATRIIWLQDGRMVADGEPASILARYREAEVSGPSPPA